MRCRGLHRTFGFLLLSIAVVPASADEPDERAAEPAPPVPVLTPGLSRVSGADRIAAIGLHFVALRSGTAAGDVLASGEAALAFPLHARVALDLRAPFVARPMASGSPSAGLVLSLHRSDGGTRSEILAPIRVYAPLASGERAPQILAELQPFQAPGWERVLTVSTGIAYRMTTPRYSLQGEMAVQTAATGLRAPRATVAYLLALAVRARDWLDLVADAAGRARIGLEPASGEPRNEIGLAAGLRLRFWRLAATAGARVPIGEARAYTPALAELSLSATF
jgi:hypothetical protein